MASNENNERRFSKQAYLVYQMLTNRTSFKEKSKISLKSLADKSKVYKVVGNYTPTNFISKVIKPKNKDVNLYKDFLDLETHKIANLVPEISFFKVVNGKYVPFYFPVSSDKVTPETMLTPGFGLNGVGIKSFSLSFTGNNPFSFDKQIEADLNIFVDNLQSIFNEPPNGYAQLAELFTISRREYTPLRDGLSKEVALDQVYKPFSHEISVRMGYSTAAGSRIFSQEELDAIENTAISLRMTLTDHVISVQQDGTATINIKYIGRLEGLRFDKNLDLLASPDEIRRRADTTSEGKKTKKVNNTSSEIPTPEDKTKQIRATHTRMRGVFEYLENQAVGQGARTKDSRIYELKISNRDIERFRTYGDTTKSDTQLKEINDTREREVSRLERLANMTKSASDPNKEKRLARRDKQISEVTQIYGKMSNSITAKNKSIHYVFTGDLIEAVIDSIFDNLDQALSANSRTKIEARKSIRASLDRMLRINFLLGSIPLRVSENSTVNVNIADIPIEIGILQSYFFKEIEQRFAKTLSIKKFVDDLVSKILPNALKGHAYRDAPFLITGADMQSTSITGPRLAPTARGNVELNIEDLPDFIRKRTPKEENDEAEYYLIFAEVPEDAPSGLNGNVTEDALQGIYHLHIGKDRGLLKTIQFSRDDVPFRKEALMVESVSLYDELKMPYRATITMVGNNLFLPGSQIYINPSSIGFGDPRSRRSAAARLGIGGYYTVISVNTSFDGAAMTTTLNAMYTSWADNDKSYVGEISSRKDKKVDASPESSELLLEVSSGEPEFDEVTSERYSGINESSFLTTQEKTDIVAMDLSRRQLESQTVTLTSTTDESRVYTINRGSRTVPIFVTIKSDNSITITKKAGMY